MKNKRTWIQTGLAAAVMLLGFVLARVLRWLMLRGARKVNDQSVAAVGALARMVGFGVYLVASAIALEMLGFSIDKGVGVS